MDIIKDLGAFHNFLQPLVKAEFEKRKNDFSSDFDFMMESPNIVYKTGKIQVALTLWKFKPDTDHKSYSDLIGDDLRILEFSRSEEDQKISEKFDQAINELKEVWMK